MRFGFICGCQSNEVIKMDKKRIGNKVEISGLDELFQIQESKENGITEVSINQLHTFYNHPFRVVDDENMDELVKSIQERGVLNPGIVRPRKGGGYEIISGHRRKRAIEIAGVDKMPVYIRNYSDEEAVIVMIDSNIQRENVLPSEKAHAYKMKYDAMKHQGRKSSGLTLKDLGRDAGESWKTVQRYIWLSRLIEPLMDMVDQKKLGLTQGIDLSGLSEKEQNMVFRRLSSSKRKLRIKNSDQIKKLASAGQLTEETLDLVFEEKREVGKQDLDMKHLRQFFSDSYSDEEIVKITYKLLDAWKNRELNLEIEG